jgi:hypothetical protein
LNKLPHGVATLQQFSYSNPIVGSIADFAGLIYSLPVSPVMGYTCLAAIRKRAVRRYIFDYD